MTRSAAVAVLLAAIGLVAMPDLRAQVPVFVSRRDVVRLDVLVTDGGRPLLGLKAADFKVLDEGVPQAIDFVSFDELPLNVVLNFDVSGSLSGQRLQDLRSAGHAVLGQLRAGDRAALVSFTEAVSLRSELSNDLPQLGAALDRSQAGGQTSLVDAAQAGLVVGASQVGRSLMMVFSDGLDTASWLAPASVIDSARRADLVVFGVTAGRSRAPFLKNLADTTGGDLVEIRTTSELRNTLVRILAEYRQRYVIAYSPSGVSAGGWHKIAVSVSRRGATVKAREGYQR